MSSRTIGQKRGPSHLGDEDANASVGLGASGLVVPQGQKPLHSGLSWTLLDLQLCTSGPGCLCVAFMAHCNGKESRIRVRSIPVSNYQSPGVRGNPCICSWQSVGSLGTLLATM